MLAGETLGGRGPLCIEHEGNRLVRDGRWKLVNFFEEEWELFDLENDPTELRNIAKSQPEIVARLSAAYDAWASRVGARPWKEAQHFSVYPADGKYGIRR